jgi:hypothetical protein
VGGEQLSQPRVPKTPLSLIQVLFGLVEPLPIEADPSVTLSQQGAETQFGWFCTIETTSARRPRDTAAEGLLSSDRVRRSLGAVCVYPGPLGPSLVAAVGEAGRKIATEQLAEVFTVLCQGR